MTMDNWMGVWQVPKYGFASDVQVVGGIFGSILKIINIRKHEPMIDLENGYVVDPLSWKL